MSQHAQSSNFNFRYYAEKVPSFDVLQWFDHPVLREALAVLNYPLSSEKPNAALPVLHFAKHPTAMHELHCSVSGCIRSAGADGIEVTVPAERLSIDVPMLPIDANRARQVWVPCAGEIGDRVSPSWRGRNQPFLPEREMALRHSTAPGWQLLSFDVGVCSAWTDQVHALRLRFNVEKAQPASSTGFIRWISMMD